jgi:hypothetical protein
MKKQARQNKKEIRDAQDRFLQTFEGRISFAQYLLKTGTIGSSKGYINFITTGHLDLISKEKKRKRPKKTYGKEAKRTHRRSNYP